MDKQLLIHKNVKPYLIAVTCVVFQILNYMLLKNRCVLVAFCISFSYSSYSQKIEKSFDKFDSIYSVSTSEELISGNILSSKRLMIAHVQFTWLKKAKYVNDSTAKWFDIIITFNLTGTTNIDKTSQIKIEFADNSFGTYTYSPDKSQIAQETGVVIFKVALGDKLFTTDIKTIRISTSDANIDCDIPTRKASLIKNALFKVKNEIEKNR